MPVHITVWFNVPANSLQVKRKTREATTVNSAIISCEAITAFTAYEHNYHSYIKTHQTYIQRVSNVPRERNKYELDSMRRTGQWHQSLID